MILTLDFETEPITPTTRWPEPVGCAVQHGSRPGRYLAWGHKGGGNNCSKQEALEVLRDCVRLAPAVAMFNAPFDVGVARRMGLEVPWSKVEDVQVLAFLAEPYAKKRDLKTFAAVELGMSSEERDDLHRWIRAFVPEAKGRAKSKLGEFYHRAPGDLVGRYARADVRMTYALWKFWRPYKGRAFAREMAVLPVLEDMTLRGVPIDHEELVAALPAWQETLAQVELELLGMLCADVDLGSHEQVADALEKAGLVKEWIETKKGARSLAYDSLVVLVAEGNFDRAFAEAWGYRSVLMHTLRAFAEPWAAAGGTLHPQWNSVKKERGEGGARTLGAVTGRLSSNPNVQNIIKRLLEIAGRPGLPNMRRYVRAPAGHRLVGVDVSQQELRILADAVGAPLSDWYHADPDLDLHDKVAAEVQRLTGMAIGRSRAKVVNLATIYKNGIASMAAKIGCTYDEAAMVKRAHARAVPGIKKWEKELAKEAVFETAGGRTYHHDPARPYKSGNTYIQGSAADQLKQIMIEAADELTNLDARLVLTAHDEIVALAPASAAAEVSETLVEIVAGTGSDSTTGMFSVPMRSQHYIRERWQG